MGEKIKGLIIPRTTFDSTPKQKPKRLTPPVTPKKKKRELAVTVGKGLTITPFSKDGHRGLELRKTF